MSSSSSRTSSESAQIPANAKVIFGKYQLGKLLGCGAFGKVFHARHIRSGASVAIKVVDKQKIVRRGLSSNIEREIAIMRRVRHPHVVKLFEVLASRSKIYFVMEYVRGGELFSKVSRGRLTEDLCRRYFQQLISAVRFCHSRGVFHRDLKPENILLDDNGDLKVSDFGLSAVADQIRDDGLFHTVCGTPAYVAPEILSKRGYDGAKVDLWSCGVILFVLNAGYLPFNDPNLMAMYRKIYLGEFRCPKWTSLDMRRMLCRLLDTNPNTRITIDEIYRDPWFRKGLKEPKFEFHKEDFGFDCVSDPSDTAGNRNDTSLNAFDIISFSSGLDLSGLFSESGASVPDRERFVSGESAEKIAEKLEEVARNEKLEVRKKGWGVEMNGQNGNFVAEMEIRQLTEDLVVVEMRKMGVGDVRSYRELWAEKVRPALNGFVHDRKLASNNARPILPLYKEYSRIACK
ncbi:hypothetical protein MRB53_003824 [Persea americana]|uniref:Uncharacterized protein n=1 Tax=Persea americana TaxID=3435 RepID=A0ACC2MYG6_PERAE|nr:hypothetical protein MRB53_003824 [Persea americana]